MIVTLHQFEMKVLCRILVVIFPAIYVIATLYIAYRLFLVSNTKHTVRHGYSEKDLTTVSTPKFHPPLNVEIWGKAAISIFLWEHILRGELVEEQGGFVKIGHLTTDDISFTFRWGPGVIQSTVPANIENLVLVLNGRAPDKISTAKQWIKYLKKYPKLKHTIVVLLGDEQCNNSWIVPYLQSNGGPLDAVFLVYDSTLVDDREVFQWPLGVATYRGFPDYSKGQSMDLTSPRSHLCNFLGTVYHNSSRQALVQILESPKLQDECILRGREKWTPLETEESLNFYIDAISKSDLTLNPVGLNTECYRIYEALALGSIPVVEDVVTHGLCDRTSRHSPLRLLKKHNAPLILVKNWQELHDVLLEESQRTLVQKVERRLSAVRWYSDFKKKMKQEFIEVLLRKFVGSL